MCQVGRSMVLAVVNCDSVYGCPLVW